MSQLVVNVGPSPTDASFKVFRLQGHLDGLTVRDMERLCRSESAQSPCKWIMDLSQLEYISSAGMGCFVAMIGDLRARGGDMFFVSVPQKILKVFRLLGFHVIFKICESESEVQRRAGGLSA